MNNPNYYAIIPANVRYNKDLTFLEKFLYCEFTALSNVDGYCFAKNKYFADLYDKDEKTISRAISHLEELGYISIEYEKNGAKITKRKISVSMLKTTSDKIVNGTETTSDKNITREQEKFLLASDKIVTDNNVTYDYILSLIMYNLPKDQKEIIKQFEFGKQVEDKIYEWLQYKREKKQSYKPTSLRSLLKSLKQDCTNNGEQYVIDSINNSIKNNYTGIFPPRQFNHSTNDSANNKFQKSNNNNGPQLLNLQTRR